MINRFLALVAVVLVTAGGLLVPTQATAQTCGKESCTELEICVKNECVCRWGDLEADWLKLLPIEDSSICSLIEHFGGGSGGAADAAGSLFGIAATFIIALTIMAGMISIVIGGYIYMTAGGSGDRIRMAKIWIGSAILGIILALLAWTILASIAGNLVGLPLGDNSPPSTPKPSTSQIPAP